MSLSALTSRLLAATTTATSADNSKNSANGSTSASSTAATGKNAASALGKKSNVELMQDLISLSHQQQNGSTEPLVYTAKQLLTQLRSNIGQTAQQSLNQATGQYTLDGSHSQGSGIAALISGALPAGTANATGTTAEAQGNALRQLAGKSPALVNAYRQTLSSKGGFTTLS